MEDDRAVFVVSDNGEEYGLCDQCIVELHNIRRGLRSIIRRDDSIHCLSCDYNYMREQETNGKTHNSITH